MQNPHQIALATLPITAALLSLALISPARAEDEPKHTPPPAAASAGQPGEAEMMKQMMDLAKPNENHKLLANMAGTWDYTVKFWMDPSKPPQESSGIAVRKAIMDGRYLSGEHNSKITMPGPEGKMQTFDFKGMSLDGYDNAKKKFINSWIDNMGTGIMQSEGTYDVATKTFTYTGNYEPMPGVMTKIRQTVKMPDADHQIFEYFETRGGQEVKTMEINSTRKK
ncbi:MAG: DUF1579 domain-containing protein [Verrucomicrobiota bacterium]|nr:DUF1579 domain-containing protein [Verrucomicrobiota bacterium]